MLFRHGRAHGVIVSYEEIDAKDKAGEAINKRNFVTLVALDLIIKGVHQYHPYATLVESIRSFLDRQWNISISYIFWEGNAIADRLVRQGASADLPLQVWDVCPPELSSLLSDVIGISIFRLV
ncbi:hypothetical protein GmHk_13G039539 [Glycine max]|nr:hypothetical protein GmHk_13G039539 [Glycine max]